MRMMQGFPLVKVAVVYGGVIEEAREFLILRHDGYYVCHNFGHVT